MKIGVLVNEPKLVRGFDPIFYHVKAVNGKINKAAKHVYNVISCFGDNRNARAKTEWVAVSEHGKALRDNTRHQFRWDWICPNVKDYKTFLLNLINETLSADIAGIHLDCIHFPRQEYCVCQRCIESWKGSGLKWVEWRSRVINEFVEQVSKLMKGKSLSITLTPDPCFAKERFGLDFGLLARYVDFFVVPIYDVTYLTTYWIEILAYCFHRQLEKPLYVELYAGHPRLSIKNLLEAMITVSCYADGIILATYDIHLAQQIQDKIVKDGKLRHLLEEWGCEPMLNVVRRWERGGDLHEPDRG